MHLKPDEPQPVSLSARIKARIMAWKFFFTGAFTFKHTIYLMLPGSLRANKKMPLSLFGKPFVLPEGDTIEDFFNLTSQIIASDNYHVALAHGTIVDAGANMGVFSVLAAATHPDATIYAFEPAPKTFAALKENTKYYPNVKVFNAGLGEKEGTISFILMGHSGQNYVGEGNNAIQVPIKTIDSLHIHTDFIKMDTEGYEANILKGAVETIRQSKPIVIMSAYHYPNDPIELPKILNAITPYSCELRADCEEDLVCKPF
jgi:FkbM family methyltransferase